MLARSKLNSIEGKVSEALINNEISHEDFMVITNKEKNYREFKENIRIMNSQRSQSSISKNVYIDKLDDKVDEYNNTYYTTIKMKRTDAKDNTYINTYREVNDKGPKFKFGDHVRISKYKNIFAKGYTPNWSEEVFVIKKS